jgi:hypothetical protein
MEPIQEVPGLAARDIRFTMKGATMLSTIQYQGYTIKAPDPPSDAGDFTSHPTPTQLISRVHRTLYWKPANAEALELITGKEVAGQPVEGTVTFQCYWDSIFKVVAQDTQVQQAVTYTTGVTTTYSDTKEFGMQFEIKDEIIPGISASLSASFSESETHTVALSASQSLTQSFYGVAEHDSSSLATACAVHHRI